MLQEEYLFQMSSINFFVFTKAAISRGSVISVIQKDVVIWSRPQGFATCVIASQNFPKVVYFVIVSSVIFRNVLVNLQSVETIGKIGREESFAVLHLDHQAD